MPHTRSEIAAATPTASLPNGRGSDWSSFYARILSIGRYSRESRSSYVEHAGQPVKRRQSAEGAIGALAAGQPHGAVPRRPDARHRYRRQAGYLPADRRTGGGRESDYPGEFGTARTIALLRPDPGAQRRTRHGAL